VENIEHTEEQDIEGIIILKWILKKENGRAWIALQ
jgi:hypothetical protein